MIISQQTARRYILGKQGLWPGRRWKGKSGTEQAMRAIEHVQLDPLNICARSHDLLLHSRVIDYKPQHFSDLTYKEKKFFDWGHWLAVRPIEELPYWRPLMKRSFERTHRKRLTKTYDEATKFVLDELRKRGPLGNRDFEGLSRVTSYRGRKDTAIALFDLWIAGEIMTHERRGFERVYDLSERVLKGLKHSAVSEEEAELFMIKKLVAFNGLTRLHTANGWLERKVTPQETLRLRNALLDKGELTEVKIEGWQKPHFALADDIKIIKDIEAGKAPKQWKPLGSTTEDEVTFLAPLDNVSARGRAKIVFEFDYIWEVYKPVHQRRWGYYVLPILFGDKLVARLDPKLDRKTNTLHVLGYWSEESKIEKNPEYQAALKAGLERFQSFLGADRLKIQGPGATALKRIL